MIHLTPKPLPDLQAKEIRDWLNLPAARAFRDVVASMAMASAAEGANAMLAEDKDPELAVEDSKLEYAKAITANNVLELMASMQHPDFQFSHFEIGPKPTITPQNEDKENE